MPADLTTIERLAIIESGLRDAAHHASLLDGHDSYVIDLLDGIRTAKRARASIELREQVKRSDVLVDELGAAIDKARA